MSAATDLYARLLALAEREHAHVVAGEWEPLEAIDDERARLLAALPPAACAPPSARATLERCLALQRDTSALLAAGVAELRRALGHVAQGRTAVKGYAGAPDAPAPRVDLAG